VVHGDLQEGTFVQTRTEELKALCQYYGQSDGEGAVCNAERTLKELLIIIYSEKVQDC
jgi:hypothetical protein